MPSSPQSIQPSGSPRVILLGLRSGPVRRLPGFKKHHFVPDNHSDATQSFVRSIAHENVEKASSELFQKIRGLYELKRRDLSYHCSEGYASLESPFFDLEILTDHDPEDPSCFQEVTQVIRLKDDAAAIDPRFHHCFQDSCDTLMIEFPAGICIEDKIDAIEDIPELANHLNYPADASSLELKIPEIEMHILINSEHASFKLLGRRDLGQLLDYTQKTLELLAPAGFPPTLTSSCE